MADNRVDIFLSGNNYEQALDILQGLPPDADIHLLSHHYYVIAQFIRMAGREYPYEFV